MEDQINKNTKKDRLGRNLKGRKLFLKTLRKYLWTFSSTGVLLRDTLQWLMPKMIYKSLETLKYKGSTKKE